MVRSKPAHTVTNLWLIAVVKDFIVLKKKKKKLISQWWRFTIDIVLIIIYRSLHAAFFVSFKERIDQFERLFVTAAVQNVLITACNDHTIIGIQPNRLVKYIKEKKKTFIYIEHTKANDIYVL